MIDFTKLIVVIPAYKPTDKLISLVNELLQIGYAKLIIIDDGSGEDNREIFVQVQDRVDLVRHPSNLGKGRALKTGLRYILDAHPNCQGIITCDADGQHRPEDIIKLSQALLLQLNEKVLILGSRKFSGKVPAASLLGNRLTCFVYSLISKKCIRDTQTGLRAFPASLIPLLLEIEGERYEYEMNVLLKLADRQVHFREIEIETVYINGNESSHFNKIKDSLKIYGTLLKFSLSSMASTVVDYATLFLFHNLSSGLGATLSLFISVFMARLLSSVFNFTLNQRWVFRSKDSTALAKYFGLVLFVAVLNYGLLHIFNLILGVPLFWAKVGVDTGLFLLNFLLQQRFVFKSNKTISVESAVSK